MPKITIEQTHALSPDEAHRRLDALNRQLSAKYGIDAKWQSTTQANFKGMGASGSIVCSPGKVSVNVDLSFALTPVKGKVESRIRAELEKALAGTGEPGGAA